MKQQGLQFLLMARMRALPSLAIYQKGRKDLILRIGILSSQMATKLFNTILKNKED